MYIGIVCPNFSGSTVVGSVLHRFSSVQHVGEIWKVFSEKHKDVAFCKECGGDHCPHFSASFKAYLKGLPQDDISSALKERFQSEFIVSGDKRPYYYKNFSGMPDKILVLLKNKYSAALSYAKRVEGFSHKGGSVQSADIFREAAESYYKDLASRVKWVESNFANENIIYASPEVIVDMGDSDLARFGKSLFGKEIMISSTPFDENFHYIGGNHKISKGKDRSYFKGEFRPDRRYEVIMSPSEKEIVNRVVEKNFRDLDLTITDTDFIESWVKDLL
ncbi:hypothetical protein ACGTN6_17975 [Halomonas sp. THAF12]|uniref:hypothetical protein n=1 Tax=Halomonas sp. B23F22_10 TaxID=3459515 RepID=UPI00373E4ED7